MNTGLEEIFAVEFEGAGLDSGVLESVLAALSTGPMHLLDPAVAAHAADGTVTYTEVVGDADGFGAKGLMRDALGRAATEHSRSLEARHLLGAILDLHAPDPADVLLAELKINLPAVRSALAGPPSSLRNQSRREAPIDAADVGAGCEQHAVHPGGSVPGVAVTTSIQVKGTQLGGCLRLRRC